MTEASAAENSPRTKDRSPSFPFIPLQTAIERLTAFEKYFGRHPAPADKAGLAWGMKPKSSQADQTLAALRSFGLVSYEGTGLKRQAMLTNEGRNYVRAQQDSIKSQILKQCALRPKVIRKFWTTWGADRPPEEVAIDQLVFENGFSDGGANNFLKVYDATISYAGLSNSDTVNVEGEDEPKDEVNPPPSSLGNDKGPQRQSTPRTPPAKFKEAKMMEGERELLTGLLSKNASFRVIVSGVVGEKEIERLIKKLEFDKEILAEAAAVSEDDGSEED